MKNLIMKDNLFVFWHCLKIIGIYRTKASSAIIKYLSPVLFIVSSIWFAWIAIRGMSLKKAAKYSTVATLGTTGAVTVIYFSLLKGNAKLKVMRKTLNFLSTKRKTDGVHIIIHFVIFIAFASPIIFSIVYFFKPNEAKREYYSIYNFENHLLRNVFYFMSILLIIFTQQTIPLLLNCFFCAVCHQWKEVIESVIDEVKSSGRDIFSNPSKTAIANSLLEKCHFIWRGTKNIKEAFYVFLFFLILIHVMVIFISIPVLVGETDIHESANITSQLVVCVFIFTSTVYLASKIPEKMAELVSTVKEMNDDLAVTKREVVIDGLIKKHLEVITNKKPIALSAGGWADLNRSFITTTLGAILTYGLIIIQNSKPI